MKEPIQPITIEELYGLQYDNRTYIEKLQEERVELMVRLNKILGEIDTRWQDDRNFTLQIKKMEQDDK